MTLKKISWILLLIGFCSNINAQNTKDSLLVELKKHTKIDTTRCRILNLIVEEEQDNTISEKYNNELFNLSSKLQKNNFNNKIKAIALQYKITAIANKGYFALMKGNSKVALNYYFEALKIAEQTNDVLQKISIYNSIGTIFDDQNENTKALYYYRKVVKIGTQNKKEEITSTALNNIGYLYDKIEIIDSAKFYYNKSLKIREKIKDSLLIVSTLANIGKLYVKEKNYDQAIKNYKICLNYELKVNDKIGATSSLLNLASVYYKKDNFKLAEFYGQKSLNLSKENNYLYGEMEAYDKLKFIYEKQKKYQDAYKMYQLYIKTKDSINNEENKNSAIKADFKYQTEKKEAKIKELNQKKKIAELQSNKKTILINSFIISFLALATIAYFLFSRFKTQKKNELLETKLAEAEKLLEAEKKATDSELKALKSQMNPHFIFNALNSIQEQFMYGDKLKGNEQLSNFTYLTRQILEVSGKKQITIATEIDILIKYLDLEKMRFAKDFEYKISIASTIDEDYHKLPPMLLQPFVENSIKHGLMHKNGLKTLTIDFDLSSNEEYLICTIQDNGIGRKKSTEIKAANQVKHNSFSTQSIEERLNLLNETLQLNDLIVYTDLTENGAIIGTKVTVNIPLV